MAFRHQRKCIAMNVFNTESQTAINLQFFSLGTGHGANNFCLYTVASYKMVHVLTKLMTFFAVSGIGKEYNF